MRSNLYSWKLLCTMRPFSIFNSGNIRVDRPSMTEPWTWFSAPLRLTIWAPISVTTTTRSTFSSPCFRHRHFGHLGDVAAVAEVKRDALALPARKRALAPAGLVGHLLQHVFHAAHMVGLAALAGARHDLLVAQQLQAEGERVAPGRMGQFVDKAVEHPGEDVAAGSAPRAHRNAAFERGLLEQAVAAASGRGIRRPTGCRRCPAAARSCRRARRGWRR